MVIEWNDLKRQLDDIVEKKPGKRDFWGAITISFRASIPVTVEITESKRINCQVLDQHQTKE